MRFFCTILFTANLLLITYVPTAQADDAVAAERAEEQARAYFKVNAFEEAAREFLNAFALEQKPSRLFNAGLAFEKAEKLPEASNAYDRFLSLETDGPKVMEARARKISVDKKLADEEERAKAARAREAHDKDVRSLADSANKLLSAGDYEQAAAEFEKTYQLSKDAEYLYDKAEALRLGSRSTDALAAYHRYLRLDPTGEHAITASQHQAKLEETIQASNTTEPKNSSPPLQPEPAQPSSRLNSAELQSSSLPGPPPKEEEGISWIKLGLGVSAIAAGVALDHLPEASTNGEIDIGDFMPVVLYGIGVGFVYGGVF